MLRDKSGNFLYIGWSQAEESIESRESNVKCLRSKCATITDDSKRQHIQPLIIAAEYIISNRPVVKTRAVGNVYRREKGLSPNILRQSMELYVIFCKHLNLTGANVSQAY